MNLLFLALFNFAAFAYSSPSSGCPFLLTKRSNTNNVLKPRSVDWKPSYKNTLTEADWEGIKNLIKPIIDDGHGPTLVRLAWVLLQFIFKRI